LREKLVLAEHRLKPLAKEVQRQQTVNSNISTIQKTLGNKVVPDNIIKNIAHNKLGKHARGKLSSKIEWSEHTGKSVSTVGEWKIDHVDRYTGTVRLRASGRSHYFVEVPADKLSGTIKNIQRSEKQTKALAKLAYKEGSSLPSNFFKDVPVYVNGKPHAVNNFDKIAYTLDDMNGEIFRGNLLKMSGVQ